LVTYDQQQERRLIEASANTLLGFAVLRANYNASSPSYLDGFQPFILSVLADTDRAFLAREAIAAKVQEGFGITIPSLVIKNLLRIMYRKGLTTNVGESAVKITDKGLESAPALQEQVHQYNQRQAELAATFQMFVADRYVEQAHLVSSEPATLLASYFTRHAAPLLNEALRGKKATTNPLPGVDFLVASFVTHLAATDTVRFGYIVEAVKGAMLSAVLLLDTSGMKESLTDLVLVIDTPVLMDVLGFHGELQQVAAGELITLALNQSARVVTFDHIVGELEGILEHISQALMKGSRSRSTSTGYLHFAETGATAVDVELLRQKLPNLLAEMKIDVISRPDGYYQYGLDEAKLEDLIQSKVNYFKGDARANDVISLSSTHRLRKGHRDRALERSKAVLVTSNVNLVLGAIQFETSQGTFPLAVTTDAVASILWVRSPAAAPDAPREMLLAAAYAGMQPSPAIWSNYLDQIDALETSNAVSADEAVTLRTSRLSRESLMDETLGQSDAVSGESPLNALERIKNEVTAPLEEQLRELKFSATQANTAANSASADWLEHLEAREKAEAEIESLKRSEATANSQLETLRLAESAKIAAIKSRATTSAHRWRVFVVVAVRLIGAALTLGAIWAFLSLPDPASKPGVLIVGVAGMLPLLGAFVPPLGSLVDAAELRLSISIQARRMNALGYPETAPTPQGEQPFASETAPTPQGEQPFASETAQRR
jgi:hypothetical protein